MTRVAFKMALKRGFEDEYYRRHNPIWQELEEVFIDHGVKSYSIFKDPESEYLFAYVEVTSKDLWLQIASTKTCRDWWHYMEPLMLVNEDKSPWATELQEVFHFEGG